MEIKNKQLRRLMEIDQPIDEHGMREVVTEDDLDNSVYNPANDAYTATSKHLQRRMTAIARQLRPSHLAIAKLIDQGMKNVHIAQQLKLNPQTITRVKQDPKVRDLLHLMRQYSGLVNGVSQAMRNAMLYRIAVRNELPEPKTAIAAIAEMNKTDHNDRTHKLNQKQGGTGQQTVIVQLADARLKPSKLDNAPQHLIRDIN